MAVEIIEAFKPMASEPPPIRPLVIKWSPVLEDWEPLFYNRLGSETDLEAARRHAKRASYKGYHVRILTVDEKA